MRQHLLAAVLLLTPFTAVPAGTPAAWARVAAAGASARSLPAAALAARHGLSITRVAVTAGGGMVDLRFTVLDPAKAAALLSDGHAPRLLVPATGLALDPPHHGAQRSIRLEKDAACFVLYPNTRGAVRPGTAVAVAFGDLSVEAISAQ
jgi:hypothetical protein